MTSLTVRDRGNGQFRRRDRGAASKRQARPLPEYLEQAEVDALIRFAPNTQAALLMLLQWRAGLRVAEAVALKRADIGDLNVARPALRVRNGKGGKDRLVPIHPELVGAFRSALAYGEKRDNIFKTTTVTAWRWVKAAQKQAVKNGMLADGKRIGTHTFRHSFARHALASGVPINILQHWLGHSSLQTTLVYLQILPDPQGHIERVP